MKQTELPLAAARRIDAACDRFEQALRRGDRPHIEDALAAVPDAAERRALLRELVVLEADAQLKAGDPPSLHEYLARFPHGREAVLDALGRADPAGAGLVARAAGLLARYGSPVRFAAKAVIGAILPGTPWIIDLVAGLFDAADSNSPASDLTTSTPLADRRRIGALLGVLDDELGELLARVAAMEGQADAARRAVDAALASDARCRAAMERLAKAGLAGDARTLGLAGEAAPRVALDVTAGPHAGLRFEYDHHDTLLVGRGHAANLQLIDDPHFSRHHFLLEFNPPRVYLRDLGSSNGTQVNGRRVTECDLNDGDEIGGGTTRIRVSLATPDPLATIDRAPSASGTGGFELSALTGDHHAEPAAVLPNFIPGYDVLRQLGEGGMGAVFLARHKGTGAEYAVKLMLPESAASERAMRLFLREVSVLSKLDHPNVVRYHDMGSAAGQFYFVMEFVPGEPLAERAAALAPEKRISFACRVASLALDGLAYAHGQGFVHRDFKPSNVLVSGSDDALRVKIGDFGLAKSFQNAGFSGMTMSGQVMGTLAFMAPEQLTHCRDAKPTADLYAVGATLYALLAGCFPLEVRKGRDAVRTLLEDEPKPIRERVPQVPPGLADAIHRALRKNPADRFADAAAMRVALERWSVM